MLSYILSGTKNHSGISMEIAPTLTAEAEKTKNVPIVFTEKRFFEWNEDDKSVTLRNAGASYGGAVNV